VNAYHLLVLLVCENVKGSQADSSRDGVPPPGWRHHPRNWCAIDGKTKDHGDVLQHHHGLPTWKVNVWVSRCHWSTSAVNAVESIIGRSSNMRRASGKNPARRMNVAYCSSHDRGLCVWILSSNNRYATQQWYKNISPNC
jgi:hypothetical protein